QGDAPVRTLACSSSDRKRIGSCLQRNALKIGTQFRAKAGAGDRVRIVILAAFGDVVEQAAEVVAAAQQQRNQRSVDRLLAGAYLNQQVLHQVSEIHHQLEIEHARRALEGMGS